MSFSKLFSFVVYLVSFSTLVSQVVLGANPLFHSCPSSSDQNYTAGYGANLDLLLGSLYLKAPPSGFGSGSFGQNPADQVYGLAQCRQDTNFKECQACVAEASSEIRKLCPSSKAATIWYDNCLLRYSNLNFFGQISQVQFTLVNVNDASDPASFNRMTGEMLIWLSRQAYLSPRKSAGGKLDLGGGGGGVTNQSQKLYGLTQCTRDLSGADCDKCLAAAINQLPICCGGKVGARVVGESCTAHYEIYPILSLVHD